MYAVYCNMAVRSGSWAVGGSVGILVEWKAQAGCKLCWDLLVLISINSFGSSFPIWRTREWRQIWVLTGRTLCVLVLSSDHSWTFVEAVVDLHKRRWIFWSWWLQSGWIILLLPKSYFKFFLHSSIPLLVSTIIFIQNFAIPLLLCIVTRWCSDMTLILPRWFKVSGEWRAWNLLELITKRPSLIKI